jgi:hypothetical protein
MTIRTLARVVPLASVCALLGCGHGSGGSSRPDGGAGESSSVTLDSGAAPTDAARDSTGSASDSSTTAGDTGLGHDATPAADTGQVTGGDTGSPPPPSPLGVFTAHNDNARSGQNPAETVLAPANVDSAHFGKKFSQPVDGFVYAQPLWVAGVTAGGKTHDVVYVATENDSVYAFDADASQPPLWQVSLGTPVPCGDTGDCQDLIPLLGITGTPVIDPATQTLFVVAETKDSSAAYHHKLHALDLGTGAEKLGGPIEINPSVAGTGGNSTGGTVLFSPLDHFQRPGLLLSGGVVYVPIGSTADTNPGVSHGWIVGFKESDLSQTMVFCTSPNGTMASIWQSGAGIAADSSGNLYAETGNGSFDADTGGMDYGDSVVKLAPSGTVLDWFSPHDEAALDTGDIDFGSAGPLLLPDQTGAVAHELIAVGKPGYLYLVNRDAMGHFQSANDSQIVGKVSVAPNTSDITGGIFATPASFNGQVYLAAVSDNLKAFSLTAGALSAAPTSQSTLVFNYPGATPSVSSNGTSAGIVWVIEGDGYTPMQSAVLHAYDATNLATELYSSTQAAGGRDAAGPAVKFSVPTVVNGHVYVGTQTELDVYGSLP